MHPGFILKQWNRSDAGGMGEAAKPNAIRSEKERGLQEKQSPGVDGEVSMASLLGRWIISRTACLKLSSTPSYCTNPQEFLLKMLWYAWVEQSVVFSCGPLVVIGRAVKCSGFSVRLGSGGMGSKSPFSHEAHWAIHTLAAAYPWQVFYENKEQ